MNEETNNSGSKQTATPIGIILLVVVLCVALAGGIYWYTTNGSGSGADATADGTVDLFGSEEAGTETEVLTELPDVVAEVNGVVITKETLEGTITQISGMYAQQGADLSDPAVAGEVRAQALESAINAEVLSQAAAAAGTNAAESTIEEELASIQAQFTDEEAFAAELETAGVTLDELRADMREQLTVNEYITNTDAFTSIPEVTEEEVRALYDQSVAGEMGEVPSFEEVKTQVEAQIIQQKQQEAVAGLVEELRAEASVEVMI